MNIYFCQVTFSFSWVLLFLPAVFLADCTNGRTYATVLRLSVVCRRRLSVCLWRYVLWLNGAS